MWIYDSNHLYNETGKLCKWKLKVDSKWDNNCGDGHLFEDEDCDDGNTNSGDGCDSGCGVETYYSCSGDEGCESSCSADCGDGYVLAGHENCDDGVNGVITHCKPGCDSGAITGWTCTTNITNQFSECYPTNCGNGNLDTGEECDDGNNKNGDGCSDYCTIEYGWECPNVGDLKCYELECGNGKIEWGEECDEGDKNGSDGSLCNLDCTLDNTVEDQIL